MVGYFKVTLNYIGGVLVSMLTYSLVVHWFDPLLSQTKDYQINIYRISP
jgi:hypothetical protein